MAVSQLSCRVMTMTKRQRKGMVRDNSVHSHVNSVHCCSNSGMVVTRRGSSHVRVTSSRIISASASENEVEVVPSSANMKEKEDSIINDSDDNVMETMRLFLEEDLKHLFDETGIDSSKYSEDVEFVDPLTKHDNIQGYLLNIQMLRYLFTPEFILHGSKQTGSKELTTRWTMNMRFNLLPWRPKIQFTGRSILTVDTTREKFTRHVDIWDSVSDNVYFSVEGLIDLLRQLRPTLTPELKTPQYTTLMRYADIEIRRYESFAVAETDMSRSGSNKEGNLVSGDGFNTLAGYIFGNNKDSMSMSMTTPVFTAPTAKASEDSKNSVVGDKVMQFVLIGPDQFPQPNSGDVVVRSIAGDKYYAVITFPGLPTQAEVDTSRSTLLESVRDKGYPTDGELILARYNDPGTLPPLRRNELLLQIPSDSFKFTF